MIPKQDTLINTEKLAITKESYSEFEPVPARNLAPLYILSGTLYLADEEEQRAYSYCAGIIPRDWNAEEARAVSEGKTDKRGFLLPNFRTEFSLEYGELCGFKEHPEPVIRGIIQARHGVFPETSHVSKLVMDCRKVVNFDN
jgi:hypothetical protein